MNLKFSGGKNPTKTETTMFESSLPTRVFPWILAAMVFLVGGTTSFGGSFAADFVGCFVTNIPKNEQWKS